MPLFDIIDTVSRRITIQAKDEQHVFNLIADDDWWEQAWEQCGSFDDETTVWSHEKGAIVTTPEVDPQ